MTFTARDIEQITGLRDYLQEKDGEDAEDWIRVLNRVVEAIRSQHDRERDESRDHAVVHHLTPPAWKDHPTACDHFTPWDALYKHRYCKTCRWALAFHANVFDRWLSMWLLIGDYVWDDQQKFYRLRFRMLAARGRG